MFAHRGVFPSPRIGQSVEASVRQPLFLSSTMVYHYRSLVLRSENYQNRWGWSIIGCRAALLFGGYRASLQQ